MYQTPKVKTLTEKVASWNIVSDKTTINPNTILRFLGEIDDWEAFLISLEHHGLAPVFYETVKHHTSNIHQTELEVLRALHLKHRLRWEAFLCALKELHASFDNAKIPLVLLKGAALTHQIYARGGLRCMEDLDILIPAECSNSSRHLLEEKGYIFSADYTGELSDHHHLPPAQKVINHQNVVIELHCQALSPDINAPIHFDNFSEPLRVFEMSGYKWQALGHIDTLTLLCRHTFSRTAVIKLSGIVDLVRYASRFNDEIDWKLVRQRHSFILNTLRLCQCVIELPLDLRSVAPPICDEFRKNMRGVGYGMAPLRQFNDPTITLSKRIIDLFSPPAWWMHIFYAVPPERSLWMTKRFKHPARVTKWALKKQWQKMSK